jgi:hypothetical protein
MWRFTNSTIWSGYATADCFGVVADDDVRLVEQDDGRRDPIALGVVEDLGHAMLVDLRDGGVGRAEIDPDRVRAHSPGLRRGPTLL